jgi:ABC-type Na+ efflux pump permease subunit
MAIATVAIIAGLFAVLVVTYVWSSNCDHRRRAADMITVMSAIILHFMPRPVAPAAQNNDTDPGGYQGDQSGRS